MLVYYFSRLRIQRREYAVCAIVSFSGTVVAAYGYVIFAGVSAGPVEASLSYVSFLL